MSLVYVGGWTTFLQKGLLERDKGQCLFCKRAGQPPIAQIPPFLPLSCLLFVLSLFLSFSLPSLPACSPPCSLASLIAFLRPSSSSSVWAHRRETHQAEHELRHTTGGGEGSLTCGPVSLLFLFFPFSTEVSRVFGDNPPLPCSADASVIHWVDMFFL